jgi:hypothetical protein
VFFGKHLAMLALKLQTKMAEDVGFEPTRRLPDQSAFKTAAIDLSANLPKTKEMVP